MLGFLLYLRILTIYHGIKRSRFTACCISTVNRTLTFETLAKGLRLLLSVLLRFIGFMAHYFAVKDASMITDDLSTILIRQKGTVPSDALYGNVHRHTLCFCEFFCRALVQSNQKWRGEEKNSQYLSYVYVLRTLQMSPVDPFFHDTSLYDDQNPQNSSQLFPTPRKENRLGGESVRYGSI